MTWTSEGLRVTAVADTSLFIARQNDRSLASEPPDEIVISAVTLGELRLGVLMAADVSVRARRLETLHLVESLVPLPVDDAVAAAWSRLVAELRAAGRKVPINDSWIAATAIANDLPVVTQDWDYDAMPGLTVIRL